MFGMVVAGLVLVLSFFTVMARINLLRFLGYSTIVDVFFTVLMFLMFHGSYGGIVAGAFAGLFMALGLTIVRNTLGYERLEFVRTRWVVKLTWVYHAPRWKLPGISALFNKEAHA